MMTANRGEVKFITVCYLFYLESGFKNRQLHNPPLKEKILRNGELYWGISFEFYLAQVVG